MKIKTEHYNHLKTEIQKIPVYQILEHGKAVKASNTYKDYNMRMRWDILHMLSMSSWLCDNLYTYMNDNHIDTALKAIMKELQLPYC